MTFFRLDPLAADGGVALIFEGRPLPFSPGQSVAGVLLAAGVLAFRETAVSGTARGPWCLMGVCFECLVVIDGKENQRACMVEAGPGMAVSRQIGARCDAAGERYEP